MHPVGLVKRCLSPSRRTTLVGLIFILTILAAVGTGIWDRRKEALRHAKRELADLDLVLAEQTTRSTHSVDLVLRELQAKMPDAGIEHLDEFDRLAKSGAIRRFLDERLRDLPDADMIALTDARGRLLARSGGGQAVPIEPSGRIPLSCPPVQDDDASIGDPASSRAGSIRSFFLVRCVVAADGTLLGAAVVAIDIDYLESLYRVIPLRTGGWVGLIRRDGTILARYPQTPARPGTKLPKGSLIYALFAKGGGTIVAASCIAGVRCLVSLHPIDRLPLGVALTVPERTVLANWRRRSAIIGGGALGVAFMLALLFRTLARRSRSLERSEAELRESEARFRDFALTSSDWLWETDAQHRFVYQSEQIRAFGQDPRNRLGRLRVDLAADAEREPEKWRDHMTVLNRHQPFRDFVYARQTGTDPHHIVSVSGNPVFDGSGRFLGYRGTARNITDQFLAERSLREAKAAAELANLAKSQFLANMSHELRTPLNAILGFVELLERGVAGPLQPRQQEYVGLVHQSGAHLLDVINELLDLARIDAGKLELHEEQNIDSRRLIDQCVRLVKGQADAAALDFSVEVADPAPLLVADRTRLTEILLNLLSNAIKFTEPGGSVHVALRRTSDGAVLFEVRDTGAGMTEAETRIALEPFGQVDPGLGRRTAGTGLGLPLARRLAELHGGSLQILSEKGIGTTVTVLLPAARVSGETAAEASPLGSAAPI